MDSLYNLYTTCVVQYRGSIALLECNGHSLEKEREGLLVMCNGLMMSAISIRAKGTRGLYRSWDKK